MSESQKTRIDVTYSKMNCFMQALAYFILGIGAVILAVLNSPWWMVIIPLVAFKFSIKIKIYLFLKYSGNLLDEIIKLVDELDWEGNEDEIERILTQATNRIKLESSDLKKIMERLKSDLSPFKRRNNE